MRKLRIWLTILTLAAIGGGGYYANWRMQTRDVNPPELKANGEDIQVSIYATDEELKSYVTAIDPEEGNVSEGIFIENIAIDPNRADEENPFKITYAAFDSAGNSSELELNMNYTDYVKPHFQLSDPLIFVEGYYMDILDYFTAIDVLDGDITPFITVEGAEKMTDYPASGIYPCTLQVMNSAGDVSTLSVNVMVEPANYTSVAKTDIYLTDYLIYLKEGDYFEPRAYLDHISDSGYCQIDYGAMVQQFDDQGNPLQDRDGNDIYLTEQVSNGSKERWVNISQITTEGTVDTSKKGTYTIRYLYQSDRTDYVGTTTLFVVVE